jgi:hypothetical protein
VAAALEEKIGRAKCLPFRMSPPSSRICSKLDRNWAPVMTTTIITTATPTPASKDYLARIAQPSLWGAEKTAAKGGKLRVELRGKIKAQGGDPVSTEAVASRRHAGGQPPVIGWKLELPTTTWHLLLN